MRQSWRPIVAAGFALCLTAQSTIAQDFMFKQPTVTAGLRLGYAVPSAGSEVFDFTRQELTVEKSDFNAFSLGAEVGIRASDRIDVAIGLGFARSETTSETREFEGTDGLPIVQDTRFSRVPFTVGAKAYLSSRGQRISDLAWIPSKWAPYVGGGLGYVWYEFVQIGEFVDAQTLDIFFDEFDSRDGSPTFYGAAGADYSLSPRWLLNGELRYRWASAAMGDDFVGFEDIDLAGFAATVGVSVRF